MISPSAFEAISTTSAPDPASNAVPAIDVRGVRFRFPSGQAALDDVSFAARAGERVAIVGPSGAGKSTLLMHLNGLLPERLPTAGDAAIFVEGVAVTAGTAADVRRRVGFLFQDPDDQLFCPTVREDVAFGPLNLGLPAAEVRELVTSSLELVGLEASYADRSTLQLSVGERKRVCLAGVFACRPSILALDEPSANLDPRARRNLLQILDRFAGCQIIATHDLDLVVEHCHRVVVLDHGKVFADGPPAQVLRDEWLLKQHGLEVPLRLLLNDAK